MYDVLRMKNDGLKKHAIAFAQDLVRTPSISLNEGVVAGKVEEQMSALEYDEVVRDDYGNTVGLLLGRESEPTVLLACHMDTVDPGEETLWTNPPLSGRVEDGRLYGLGASDCKGGLAAQVFAGGLLKRSLLPLKGNLVVAATVAEENGRSLGIRGLMEETLPGLGLKPDYAILGEPTGLGLYYGHDGWLEIEINVGGSNPFHVDDATQAIYREMQGEDTARRETRPFEEIAVHAPRYTDSGGLREATIQVERRLYPTDDVDAVLGSIKHNASLAADTCGSVALAVDVRRENQCLYTGQTVTVQHVTHAWSTDPFHPLVSRSRQALAAAGCTVSPGKWELGRLGMGTAGGTLATQFDVPAIGYGPGLEEAAHAPNEYVEIEKIGQAVYGTAAIVHSLIGTPVFGWTSDDI